MERLESEYDIDVEWKGLEIRPQLPPNGRPRETRPGDDGRRQVEESIRQLAADVGLEMRSPDVIANTHLALEAAEFARERGRFAALHRRIFEAYFQNGRNISEAEVLVELADEMGLDGQALRQALAERRYQGQLEQVTREAAELGVRSTPTYVIGDRRVVGAKPYEVLREQLISAGAKLRRA